MEATNVNILKTSHAYANVSLVSRKTLKKKEVVLHRPPSGKPKASDMTSSSDTTNVRNQRLRMPLPPQNDENVKDTVRARNGVPVSSPSPSTLPRSQSPVAKGTKRIRPQSANPVLSTAKPVDLDLPKESEKVFFSPVVEILNAPTPKVSAYKVNNLQLDLKERELPVLPFPEKPLVKKSWGETSVTFGRKVNETTGLLIEKFLETSSQRKPNAHKLIRPSSATTYRQNIGAPIPISKGETVSYASCKQRLASASILRQNCITESNPDSEKIEDGNVLEPFVFGFKSNQVMCGSETDLTNMSTAEEFTPYELSEPSAEVSIKWDQEKTQSNQCSSHGRNVPKTLQSLIPWLTEGLPLHWTGINAANCLMFLPSLQQHGDDLPVVPAPHGLTEDLPYKEVVLPKEIWKPKKYPHASFKRAQEWQCKHNKTEVRLYNKDGILLYERYQGTRTKNVVRKEIAELENLMKGIGTDGSSCMVVQFQADITRLRKMVDDTLKLADHPLFKRPATPEPTDYFGLRKFYQEHDKIMAEIEQQHSICVQELALIENKLEMDEGLRHFKKVVTLVEAGMS